MNCLKPVIALKPDRGIFLDITAKRIDFDLQTLSTLQRKCTAVHVYVFPGERLVKLFTRTILIYQYRHSRTIIASTDIPL